MAAALTAKQAEVLEFIRQYQAKRGTPPQLIEIAAHFGISSPGAHKHLDALQRKGYVFFGRLNSPTFGLIIKSDDEAALSPFSIPVLGGVGASGEVTRSRRTTPLELPMFRSSAPWRGIQFALGVIENIPELALLELDALVVDRPGGGWCAGDLVVADWPEIEGGIVIRYRGATIEGLPAGNDFIDPAPLWPDSEMIAVPDFATVWHPMHSSERAVTLFREFFSARRSRAEGEASFRFVGIVSAVIRLRTSTSEHYAWNPSAFEAQT